MKLDEVDQEMLMILAIRRACSGLARGWRRASGKNLASDPGKSPEGHSQQGR
ncbi:hypothetical protein [Sphaerotilus mobilis]|uniref:hypothetical protein n=1 Tax=Sphaerotilus mobilis TaxID=47994 RepID=UPI001A92A9A1|nr:hypothetical protein [Sphaerotilus mobilis]